MPPTPQADAGPTAPAAECNNGKDCNDNDACTTDVCVDGDCIHTDIVCSSGMTCNVVGQCVVEEKDCGVIDDGNLCTVDSCNAATGVAAHTPKGCDDGFKCSKEQDGACVPIGMCTSNADCNYGVSCTDDTCNPESWKCQHSDTCLAGEKFCSPGANKCVEPNPCPSTCPWGHLCNLSTGECEQVVSCGGDDECDDDKPCTVDLCGVDGICNFVTTCGDGEACTEDGCEDIVKECLDTPVFDPTCEMVYCDHKVGEWVSVPVVSCKGGVCVEGKCLIQQCFDAVDCPVNPCASKTICTSDWKCEYFFGKCSDDEVCTIDGDCIAAPCETASDCGDGNPDTDDFCLGDGTCANVLQVTCAEGTEYDAETASCKAVLPGPCVAGEVACKYTIGFSEIMTCLLDNSGQTFWQSSKSCGPETVWYCSATSDPPTCKKYPG